FGILFLLLISLAAELGRCADRPAGRVVWWGWGVMDPASRHTNGVVENGREAITNAVAITADDLRGMGLRRGGTVLAFGSDIYGGLHIPPGLSNVTSIAIEGSSSWAIRRDGTVARWGTDEDEANVVAGLSNISMVAWAGYRSYLALKNDGTLLGL